MLDTFTDQVADALRRAHLRKHGVEKPLVWGLLKQTERDMWRAKARRVRGRRDGD